MFWKRAQNSEFKKVGPNGARSKNGFSVRVIFRGNVEYEEAGLFCIVEGELMGSKDGIYLYKDSRGNKAFENLSPERTGEIFANIQRALEFLGMEVVIV